MGEQNTSLSLRWLAAKLYAPLALLALTGANVSLAAPNEPCLPWTATVSSGEFDIKGYSPDQVCQTLIARRNPMTVNGGAHRIELTYTGLIPSGPDGYYCAFNRYATVIATGEFYAPESGPWSWDGVVPSCKPLIGDPRTCGISNPVLPDLGLKVESSVDYQGAGAHPLNFARHYRSQGTTPGNLDRGQRWQHAYSAALLVTSDAKDSTRTATVWRPSGAATLFTQLGTGPWTEYGKTRDTLIEVRDVASRLVGYSYRVFADDSVESFGIDGKLQSIKARNGWLTRLTYNASGELVSVKNQFGRELRLSYDAQGRIAELLPPGAVSGTGAGSATSPIRYGYEEAASLGAGVALQGQLTSVTWQDGYVRRYHYEDNRFADALTGITDEAGVRYSTYTYDSRGRAVHTEHAGGVDRVDLHYGIQNGLPVTIVTDYSGAGGSASTRTYSFTDIGNTRYVSAVTAPCPLCGNTQASTGFDATGNATRTIGHDGVVTFYAYDAKGRETERAEFPASFQSATTRPALSAATRVVSTQWHATWNLSTKVAEPNKTTANTYNSKGNLTGQSWTATTDGTGAAKFAAVKTGSTYATGWGYSTSSLATSVVEKVNATETGRWTLAYNASGDVATIKDVPRNITGQVTQYDAQGRVLAATNIDGDAIDLAYTPRGFVNSRTEDGKTNTYVQNAIGLTTEVRMPGGQVATFEYSAAHRLTAVRLNGALIAKAELRDGVPDSPILARTVELLERMLGAMLRPAYAQTAAAAATSFGSGVAPAMGLPGQPGVNASAILMSDDRPGNASPGGLLPRFDPATRRLAEVLTGYCKCDPSGGYVGPKLTALSMIHIFISGHTAPVYRNKSYFSEPVNQALVDEVMSKAPERVQDGNETVYYVSDMGRFVGYRRGLGGTFELTRDVTLRVHADNCNNLLRVRNEVVTMHPGRPK